MCVCVCVCKREREREKKQECLWERVYGAAQRLENKGVDQRGGKECRRDEEEGKRSLQERRLR